MTSGHEADAEQIGDFLDAVFRHADAGTYIALQAIDQGGPVRRTVLREGVKLNGDAHRITARIAAEATRAANMPSPMVFCPAIATFGGPHETTGADIANGVALSIDLDEPHPAQDAALLRSILGPPTLEIASGGQWTDPATGEVHEKLHLHFRLRQPTRTPDEHDRLREARRLALVLAGGDPTPVPTVPLYRWPGSWNRKREPGRMARIVAVNDGAEVELGDALELLRMARCAHARTRGSSSKRVV